MRSPQRRLYPVEITRPDLRRTAIKIQLVSEQGTIEVADLLREEPSLVPNGRFTQYRYRFECQEGEISLVATGYKIFVRRRPILQRAQGLSLAERNGIGFARGLGMA